MFVLAQNFCWPVINGRSNKRSSRIYIKLTIVGLWPQLDRERDGEREREREIVLFVRMSTIGWLPTRTVYFCLYTMHIMTCIFCAYIREITHSCTFFFFSSDYCASSEKCKAHNVRFNESIQCKKSILGEDYFIYCCYLCQSRET